MKNRDKIIQLPPPRGSKRQLRYGNLTTLNLSNSKVSWFTALPTRHQSHTTSYHGQLLGLIVNFRFNPSLLSKLLAYNRDLLLPDSIHTKLF